MATRGRGGHGSDYTDEGGPEVNSLRRVFAWLLVSIVVLSLVATLIVEEAA
jgi:hypothetical protein